MHPQRIFIGVQLVTEITLELWSGQPLLPSDGTNGTDDVIAALGGFLPMRVIRVIFLKVTLNSLL
jgi:hypothetical protein